VLKIIEERNISAALEQKTDKAVIESLQALKRL
jgi:hypothetical protein